MRIEIDTRALKIDPRAFYWWATLALGCLVITAGALKSWGFLALAVVADAGAYWRLRWAVKRHSARRDQGPGLPGRGGWPGPPRAYPPPPPRGARFDGIYLTGCGAPPPPPDLVEPRRVHGLCMLCRQDVFFDPAAENAGICEACAGGPG